MSQLERIYAFHQKLKNNRFLNARTLQKELELSRTAHRDIRYLRDRLLAPGYERLMDNVSYQWIEVADDREIMMKILQYGSMAKVLEPESLQKHIAGETKERERNKLNKN